MSSVLTTTPVPAPRPPHARAVPLQVIGPDEPEDYVNLDYAATAPCLATVADEVSRALADYGSAHRGAGLLSRRTTRRYEAARATVAEFLGCRAGDTVVFTRNTTDSTNLLAHALPDGTRVVVFGSEHHATLLPWRHPVRLPIPTGPAAAVRAAGAAFAELRRDGDDRPILLAVTGASNVTGELWPVGQLATVARRYGARVFLDAAQLAPHRPVDVAALGVDYVAISGHKLYAPYGAGVLAGRTDWLDAAPPYLAGGGASRYVGDATGHVEWASGAARHESGSPNLVGAVALAAACRVLSSAGRDRLAAAEQRLLDRLRTGLRVVPGLRELSMFGVDHPRVGIVAFVLDGIDSADLAHRLDERYRIGVRAGLFCAHPLTRRLLGEAGGTASGTASGTTNGTASGADRHGAAVRASLGVGCTAEHVDRLVTAVTELREELVGGEHALPELPQ